MSAQNNLGFAKLLKWKQSHDWDGYQTVLVCDVILRNTNAGRNLFSHEGIRGTLTEKDQQGVAQLLDNARNQSVDPINDLIIEFVPNDGSFQTTFGYIPGKFEVPHFVIPKITINKKDSLGNALPGATFKLSDNKG